MSRAESTSQHRPSSIGSRIGPILRCFRHNLVSHSGPPSRRRRERDATHDASNVKQATAWIRLKNSGHQHRKKDGEGNANTKTTHITAT